MGFKDMQNAARDLLRAKGRAERGESGRYPDVLKKSVKAIVAEGISKYAPDAKLTEAFILPRVLELTKGDSELAAGLINECAAEVMIDRLESRSS